MARARLDAVSTFRRENMRAKKLAGCHIRDELDQPARVTCRERTWHIVEREHRCPHTMSGGYGLRFGQADARYLRICMPGTASPRMFSRCESSR